MYSLCSALSLEGLGFEVLPVQLVLCLVPDRASVENDDIGILLVLGIQHPHAFKLAPHTLRVGAVHLAPHRLDAVPEMRRVQGLELGIYSRHCHTGNTSSISEMRRVWVLRV
jgi:hypothetical protein